MDKSILNVTKEDQHRESLEEMDDSDFSIPETKNATPEWIAAVKTVLRRDIENVKILLANGYPNDPKDDDNVTSDVSLIGVAAYAGLEMFETVYNACPEALERARYDMWNPLCIAITKNDRHVSSRLLALVEDPLRASKHSRRIIIRSKIPEIARYIKANYPKEVLEDFINESLEYLQNDIEHFNHPQMSSTMDNIYPDYSTSADELNNIHSSKSLPSACRMSNDKKLERNNSLIEINSFEHYSSESWTNEMPLNSTFNDEDKMHKYKFNRPPDLEITEDDVNSESDILSAKTPIESTCGTPSAAMVLDAEQKKMAVVLQRFGLKRFVFTFLNEEVDLDLFLTLNERDLREIGIQSKSDRIVLLSVIEECNRYHV